MKTAIEKNICYKTHCSIEKTWLHITEKQLPMKERILRTLKTAQLTLIFVGSGHQARNQGGSIAPLQNFSPLMETCAEHS